MVAALCGSAAAVAWQRRLATWDDGYIYARTVRNVLEGRGWTFNPGAKLDACTSPLYFALLLGTSAGLRNPELIPHAAAALYGITLAGVAVLMFLGLRSRTGWVMALLAAAGFLHHPYIETLNGVETLLLLACCLAALWTYGNRRYTAAAFLLALAVHARPDALILAGLVATHYVLARRRFVPPAACAAFLLPLIAWGVLHYSQFSTLLPETLSAKRAQGRSGLWRPFAEGLEASFMEGRPKPIIRVNRAGAAAALFGLGVALARRDAAVVLLGLYAAAHFGAYSLLGVPYYHWYYGPEYLAAWVLIAVCLSLWYRLAAERSYPRTEGGLAVIAWGAMAALIVATCDLARRHPYRPVDRSLVQPYFHLADRIRPLLQPGDSVLVTEVGALGWALPQQVVEDTVGLTGLVPAADIRQGRFNTWLARDDARLPDHVLALDRFAAMMFNGDLATTMRFEGLYESALRVEQVEDDPAGAYRATLYRRRLEPQAAGASRSIALLPMIRAEQLKPPEMLICTIADRGRIHPALFQHPTNRLTVETTITRRFLVFGYGLRPEVYGLSDGVRFMITVEEAGETITAFDQAVRPRDDGDDRQWLHAFVDLAAYMGRTVRITFATEPLEAPTHDAAAWLSPRLADQAAP